MSLDTLRAKAKIWSSRFIPPQHCIPLSNEAYREIRFFRHPDVRVLDGVIHHKVKIENGVIVLMCCDGDRFLAGLLSIAGLFATKHRWSTRVASWMKRTSLLFIWAFVFIYPRMHVISRHAGAHRVVKGSRTNAPGRATDKDLLDDIMMAIERMGIYQIVLLDHCACLKLGDHNFTVNEQFHDLFEARDRIVAEYAKVRSEKAVRLAADGDLHAATTLPNLQVICMCQVDYGKKTWWQRRKLRTYHLDGARLIEVDITRHKPAHNPKIARAISDYLEAA
ncbi:MAG: hypothetical protein AAB367_00310 [Patescibacteria group bacterium]